MIGPLIFVTFVLVKFLIRLLISVDFPTFGGPTTAMTIGGGSSGVLSMTGMCCFFATKSCLRWNLFWALLADVIANPLGFFVRSVGSSLDFFAIFLLAFTPEIFSRFLIGILWDS